VLATAGEGRHKREIVLCNCSPRQSTTALSRMGMLGPPWEHGRERGGQRQVATGNFLWAYYGNVVECMGVALGVHDLSSAIQFTFFITSDERVAGTLGSSGWPG
jgi:hypothetical protein